MKTPRKAFDLILAKLKEDYEPADMDSRYRAMLDECYSFKSVGGPFAYMQPSSVLEHEDPTAYRCGFNDWLDGEDVTEIGTDNWDDADVEEARKAVVDELNDELSVANAKAESIESDRDNEEDDGVKTELNSELEAVLSEAEALETLIKEVESESF